MEHPSAAAHETTSSSRSHMEGLSRRHLLSAGLAGGLTPLLSVAQTGTPLASSGTGRRLLTPSELKQRVRGPIGSVTTPFTADEKVDFRAVRTMLELGLKHGIKIFEVTAGDSLYRVLSYDEIKELAKTLVETVGDRAVVIAATGDWWTERVLDYVQYVESLGFDGVQVLVPKGEDEDLLEHYQRIARSTKLGIVLQGKYSMPLMHKLVEIESVVAMKEDAGESFMFDVTRRFHDRLAIFGGGLKWRYLLGRSYGLVGYLSTYASFAPQITTWFWDAIEAEDVQRAREIMLKYDAPMFDLCFTGDRSYAAYIRAVLEYFGVATRHLRRPEAMCTDAHMATIRRFFEGIGVTPET